MNATELAHWRYRVKALTVDLAACKKTLREMRDSDPFVADFFAQEIPKVEAELDLNRYLLEEAKYMSELGELTLI